MSENIPDTKPPEATFEPVESFDTTEPFTPQDVTESMGAPDGLKPSDKPRLVLFYVPPGELPEEVPHHAVELRHDLQDSGRTDLRRAVKALVLTLKS